MDKQTLTGVLIALVLGGGGGYWAATWFGSEKMTADVVDGMAADETKVLFYRNPMNPAITSPVPAQDEMGMDYIPVYADE